MESDALVFAGTIASVQRLQNLCKSSVDGQVENTRTGGVVLKTSLETNGSSPEKLKFSNFGVCKNAPKL